MRSLSRLLRAALLACLMSTATAPARADVVTIGHPSLTFYEVTANLVQFMFERLGWSVAIRSGSHSQIFPQLGDGSVDLLVAAWLPDAHAVYWNEHKENLVQVTTLYEDAKLYWSVPAYVPAEAVKSVADLAKPEVAAKMVKTIRGTLPDSGLMIGSKKIFEHYALGAAGYELVTGPAKDWIANFEQRIGAKEWFVMPLWQPQYLNRAHKMRVLEEPQKLLGGPNRAVLVASKSFWQRIDKRQRETLTRMELSLKAVTEMDYWVNVEKMSPRDAARRWIGSNPNTVTYWIQGPEED
jgi:glycine betaine/proline transport system substrate-binding protein